VSTLRYGRPLWLDQPFRRPRRYPTLRRSLTVDVVVIGAGITGAIAAYLFSDAGVRVAVLDARRAGEGSTAASTALLMQEPDKDLRELTRRYGRTSARRIWTALRAATRDLVKSIQHLGIPCDLQASESIYFTLDPRKLPHLQREFKERKRAGLPGRWLSEDALYRRTGIRGEGAIATPGNAEVNPLKACRGFIAAAVSRGAQVFEKSAVTSVTHTATGVNVRTAGGVIHASQVLVATGYATRDFKPLVGRFRLKDTFVVTTRRLPGRAARSLLDKNTMLWDTDRPYHYLRWTNDGRLMLGGEDLVHRSQRGAAKRLSAGSAKLRAHLALLYPELADERVEYAWEGLFAETSDGLPYVGTHRRYPRHLFALGYGGNGMTASFLAAQLLLARYRKRRDPRASLFAFNR
jgi:glycine/D-amino acid oxidase-like deaminating enzyme